MSAVRADALRAQLERSIARVRLPIDPACRALLDRLVAVALERLDTRSDDAAAASDMQLAVDHLQRLLDDMTQQARILRLDALHPPLLIGALQRLRPLWPYC